MEDGGWSDRVIAVRRWLRESGDVLAPTLQAELRKLLVLGQARPDARAAVIAKVGQQIAKFDEAVARKLEPTPGSPLAHREGGVQMGDLLDFDFMQRNRIWREERDEKMTRLRQEAADGALIRNGRYVDRATPVAHRAVVPAAQAAELLLQKPPVTRKAKTMTASSGAQDDFPAAAERPAPERAASASVASKMKRSVSLSALVEHGDKPSKTQHKASAEWAGSERQEKPKQGRRAGRPTQPPTTPGKRRKTQDGAAAPTPNTLRRAKRRTPRSAPVSRASSDVEDEEYSDAVEVLDEETLAETARLREAHAVDSDALARVKQAFLQASHGSQSPTPSAEKGKRVGLDTFRAVMAEQGLFGNSMDDVTDFVAEIYESYKMEAEEAAGRSAARHVHGANAPQSRLDVRHFLTTMLFANEGLSLEERRRTLFEIYDTDGDGLMKQEEFGDMVERIVPGKQNEDLRAVMLLMFRGVDRNNDYRISYDEYVKAYFSYPIVADRLVPLLQPTKLQSKVHQERADELRRVPLLFRAMDQHKTAERHAAEVKRKNDAYLERLNFHFAPSSTERQGVFIVHPDAGEFGTEVYPRSSGVKGVHFIVGKHPTTFRPQLLFVKFDLDIFTEIEAASWWSMHGSKYKDPLFFEHSARHGRRSDAPQQKRDANVASDEAVSSDEENENEHENEFASENSLPSNTISARVTVQPKPRARAQSATATSILL